MRNSDDMSSNMFGGGSSGGDTNMFGDSSSGSDTNMFGGGSSGGDTNMFGAAVENETSMYSHEEIERINQEKQKEAETKKKKIKGIIFVIIGVLVAALLAVAVLLAPKFLVKFGDDCMETGDFDGAVGFYKMCFGTNGSKKRLDAINSIDLFEAGKTEEGIAVLLDHEIAVNINYDLNGGSFINSDRQTSVTLSDKSKAGDLYKAKKDYYSFDGWELVDHSYSPKNNDSSFDVQLKAKFVPAIYKISYTNLFSDASDNPDSYTYESETITLNPPTRDGYRFLYWSGTDIQGNPTSVEIPKGSHGDRAYIANWEPNKYTVTLNPDVACEIPGSVEVTYNNDYNLPQIEKRGYTYKGWSDGKDEYASGVWTTLSDISVTPVWQLDTYNLTYDLDGGSIGTANPSSYTVVSDDIKLNNPTKRGYTFQGWASSDNAHNGKDVVIKKDSVGNIDFKALWRGNPYKIKLDPKGGAVQNTTVNVTFGSNYSIPIPSRLGYTFAGWYSGNTKVGNGVWSQENDLSVEARWTANKYTASLNAAGGNVSSTSVTVTFDTNYSLPTPSRKGYTFVAWYNGQSKFPSSGTWKSGSNLSLTAGWEGNRYNVSLNASGGSVSQSTVTVTFGSTYSLPTPVKAGYDFNGWYSGSTEYPVTGTWDKDNGVSLSARWVVGTFTAVLDPDGGKVSSTSVSCKYGSSYSLPTPTKQGYKFLGWYRGNDKVADRSTWKWDTDIILKAKWEAIKYKITLNLDGGTLIGYDKNKGVEVTYGLPYFLSTPTKQGYTFEGWYNGSTKYTNMGLYKEEKNITLTAKWTKNTYTAILMPNGGTVSKTEVTCKYNDYYSLPTPVWSGYTFKGWYNGNEKIANSGKWTWESNLVLSAVWVKK